VITGINWYTSFDHPLPTGECPLTAEATVRGGHEVELFGLDVEKRQIWAYQSWGRSWGGLGNGTFWFSYDTFAQLLAEKGDVTAFTV
jgi:C1A family cysteine protease